MKSIPHLTLLVTLFAATLAGSGCILPLEGPAGSHVSRAEVQQVAPHRCRSALSQSTQKGCPAPTHAEIASQVSTTREQVTRELSALSKRGLLRKNGSALVVTDLEELERLLG